MQSPRSNILVLVRWAFDAFLLIGVAAIVASGVRVVDWNRVWTTIASSKLGVLPVAFTGLLVASSWGVFWLREHRPRSYGWAEIAVGATTIMLAFLGTPSSFEGGIKIISGLYLMVRGHDNRINGFRRLQARAKPEANPAATEPHHNSSWWRAIKM
jgi:hypothetical protein